MLGSFLIVSLPTLGSMKSGRGHIKKYFLGIAIHLERWVSKAGTFAAVEERDSAWSGKGDGMEDQAVDNLPEGQREWSRLLTFFFFFFLHSPLAI